MRHGLQRQSPSAIQGQPVGRAIPLVPSRTSGRLLRPLSGLLHELVTVGLRRRVRPEGVEGLVLDGGPSTEAGLSASAVLGPFDPGDDLQAQVLGGWPRCVGPGRCSAAGRRSSTWRLCRRRRRPGEPAPLLRTPIGSTAERGDGLSWQGILIGAASRLFGFRLSISASRCGSGCGATLVAQLWMRDISMTFRPRR